MANRLAGQEPGLTGIAESDLEILLQGLLDGRVAALDQAGLQALGLGRLGGHLGPLAGLPKATALPALRAVVAERRKRSGPRLELVWTGPEAALRPARDTAVVIRELFGRARDHVLVCGYSFDHGLEILAALHTVIRDHGVQATFFLDIPRAPNDAVPEAYAVAVIERFLAENWSSGVPRPRLFYDPRTVAPDALASLHAKCAVVDGRWSLVSSANFTDRGLHRNLEVGVLIDDCVFASRLREQCLSLVSGGLMREYQPVVR